MIADTMPSYPVCPRCCSTFATFANITKAIVGAGSFALPYAFKNMGLVGGCVIITLSGILW